MRNWTFHLFALVLAGCTGDDGSSQYIPACGTGQLLLGVRDSEMDDGPGYHVFGGTTTGVPQFTDGSGGSYRGSQMSSDSTMTVVLEWTDPLAPGVPSWGRVDIQSQGFFEFRDQTDEGLIALSADGRSLSFAGDVYGGCAALP